MRFILVCFALVATLPAGAQIQTFQTSLTDSTLPLLYVGVANTLRIEGVQEPYSVQVSNGGEVVQRGPGLYEVEVEKPGPMALTIRKAGREVFVKAMAANYTSDPMVTIGGLLRQRGQALIMATVAQVIANPRLVIRYERPVFYRSFISILSFEYSVYSGQTLLAQGKLTGADFSPAFIRSIQWLHSKDRIFLDNIRVVGPDGRGRMMGSVVAQIQ